MDDSQSPDPTTLAPAMSRSCVGAMALMALTLFGASGKRHEERPTGSYWTCPGSDDVHPPGSGQARASPPTSACSFRVIATLTDLVYASCLCTQLAQHPGEGMSSERASWMVQDATQAFSTTRWVDGGVSCPRKERYPKFGHVPLAVCRVADHGFCVCVRNF